jgi:multimeric flavodoxin WrbA
MTLNKMQTEMCKSSKWNFSDLQALFLNCTLKRSPDISHTQGLIDISQAIMEKMGVSVEVLRPVEYNIAYGVWPDMKEHGWEKDDWPEIYEKVKAAHILVITSPIWLGEKSSVGTKVIERLYSTSGDLNEHGQYAYYGRVGGCLITGNEDGAKHCSMNILYSLQHLGYVIPPQADAAWLGEAGPGPSYFLPIEIRHL